MTQHNNIKNFFSKNREVITAQWIDYALSTYQSSEFFKNEKDPFANPIGSTVSGALSELLPLLVENTGRVSYEKPLQTIIALRAVQQFTPSQAVAPINAIKHIVREIFTADMECQSEEKELYDFDFAVDIALLAAFDIYMQFRERLHNVRIKEIKSGSHILTDSKCPSKMLTSEDDTILKQVGK